MEVGSPELDTVHSMWPHQGTAEEEDHLSQPPGCTLLNAPRDPIGPLGHQGILLAHSHPLLNHWSTCWLLEPPWGMLLAHSHPVVNHWSTPAQPVGHHWPSGHTAGSRSPCWPTVGQLRHHWPSWPEEHTAGLWSTSGQLLANQNTTPGHQGTLSAHSHPTANRTDPQVLLCRSPFQQL